jgi:acyl-coenzyme A synthetase/AMP-(fatty) acid ligase
MTATSSILAENMIVRAEDRMIMMAPMHYASSLGLFFPLPAGCSTYIVSEEEAMFPQAVAEILEHERVSMWIGAATRLRLLTESGELDRRDCSSVRYVEFFGEPMPIQSLHRAMRCFSNAKFQNTYGSSEAFWMSRFSVSDELPAHLETLPIGKPLPCYEFFLRDENENTVAAGDVGEICVVGPVALTGYWKRPDLSAAARLNGISNSYRTGDLARLGADGNYHFVGRRDHQVKIRGHRFELGEIETVLRSHSSVRDAVAFLDGQEIRACILAENHAGLASEIRAICAQRLPVFARPKHVAVLDQFPQLASGKIDRMALQKTSEIWGLH